MANKKTVTWAVLIPLLTVLITSLTTIATTYIGSMKKADIINQRNEVEQGIGRSHRQYRDAHVKMGKFGMFYVTTNEKGIK